MKQNTDEIIDELSSSENFRELEKNYRTLSLKVTDEIIDRLSPS